jgi:FlaA1/EpsC-like NDP-sugar epimerase/lipopolysaccharide/colanic/teichoic acid biosynthesis glycosyltransferase
MPEAGIKISRSKRVFDIIFSGLAIIVLSPVLVLLALWVKLDSRGNIFVRHTRIGQYGKPFKIIKFRTSRSGIEFKPSMKIDTQLTSCGRFLCQYHLDQLPLLFNVFKGDMSLVGPRPEIPEHVALYPDSIRDFVLSVPVGMTDYALVEFSNEKELLAASEHPDIDYVEKILPIKLAYHQQYVVEHSFLLDIVLILKTFKRLFRRFPVLLHDVIMVAVAWTLAMVIRYDLPLEPHVQQVFWQSLPVVLGVQSIVLWYNGLYQGIWRFSSMPDVANILRAVSLGTLASVLLLVLLNRLEGVPRSSLLLYPFILILLLGMPRLFYRLLHEHSLGFLTRPSASQRVLVLGAGTSGDMLVRDMLRNPECGYIPVGFLDDKTSLHGGKVQGVPVIDQIDQLPNVLESMKIDLIIIAMPSASDEQMQHVVEVCEPCNVPFRTLPKFDSIVNNEVDLSAVREVSIDDLLGRAKVQLDWELIQTELHSKVVMVTGGGGSIGSELCRQIARLNPTALVIFERSEFNLYRVELQLRQEFPHLILHACLGDIVDAVAVRHVLQQYRPEVVFHAAAYKHVPMLQNQAREAVRNNVLGTKILAEAAAAQGCAIFVMISTDKAVNPTNIMGASKRAAEIFCQALSRHSKTRFITVRFGNVLGSAGSVVPLFKEQIARGGPVTVTHAEISRYFMTIPEACQLILQAAAMGKGGEIFVLDMGKPVKIRYLAEQMIRLSGKKPERDIKIVYTGLRAGEKLYEELFHADERLEKTPHAKILLAAPRQNDWAQLIELLTAAERACDEYAAEEVQNLLQQLVPEMNLSEA